MPLSTCTLEGIPNAGYCRIATFDPQFILSLSDPLSPTHTMLCHNWKHRLNKGRNLGIGAHHLRRS